MILGTLLLIIAVILLNIWVGVMIANDDATGYLLLSVELILAIIVLIIMHSRQIYDILSIKLW